MHLPLPLTTELPQARIPQFLDQHPNRGQAGTYFGLYKSIDETSLEIVFSPSSAIDNETTPSLSLPKILQTSNYFHKPSEDQTWVLSP